MAQNDDLENRLRRNNLILHGIPESPDDDNRAVTNVVSKFLTETLSMDCPQIERCHRLGRRHTGRTRPIIFRLLDFREKIHILKNASKLKGSDQRISEDYSNNVRFIRRKLWEATRTHCNSGSSVRIVYDHVFIDNIRYNWDVQSNTIFQSRNHDTVAMASPSATTPTSC